MIFLRKKDNSEVIHNIWRAIHTGEDVVIDDLDILDTIIFDPDCPSDLRFKGRNEYTLGLTSVKGMREFGYDVLE